MIKDIYVQFLFNKRILVGSEEAQLNNFDSIYALARLFGIRVSGNIEGVDVECVKAAEKHLGMHVPEAFYVGFPTTVRLLSPSELLFDQLLHYYSTYGRNCFDGDASHSVFETNFTRDAFKEDVEVKEFTVIKPSQLGEYVVKGIKDLLLTTRPLNSFNTNLVIEGVKDFYPVIDKVASKDTAIQLLLSTNETRWCKYLNLTDVIKFVEKLNFTRYNNDNIKKLNLTNKDRKLVKSVIDKLVQTATMTDIKNCLEKKQLWCGLLHHLHYKPKCDMSRTLVSTVRDNKTASYLSQIEYLIQSGDISRAALIANRHKGSAFILRNLNYMLSRCKNIAEVSDVLDNAVSNNPIVILQLLLQYMNYSEQRVPRTFTFAKNNMLKNHRETAREVATRKSFVSKETRELAIKLLKQNLKSIYSGSLNKVYIDQSMSDIALPIQESTSLSGYGILPRGSKFTIPEGKKVRLFTYWEKVNDIDLSSIGIDKNGEVIEEFSWRTFYNKNSDAVTFSGDITNGYKGGSEYIDVDIDQFRTLYPDIRYIVCCDNVFSGTPFDECVAKGGYMLRDINDSGEIFEPKTVQSSFLINGHSTFCYMFALDVVDRKFIWLNTILDSNTRIAGTTKFDFLIRYMKITDELNVKNLFEMLSTEVVNDYTNADVIVSDNPNIAVNEGQTIIRSYDIETIMKYMNNNK